MSQEHTPNLSQDVSDLQATSPQRRWEVVEMYNGVGTGLGGTRASPA